MISSLPERHFAFLNEIIDQLGRDSRIVGLLGGGSMVHGGFDEFSDLDIVVVVKPDAYAEVMAARRTIAEGLGPLLTSFTGEHVGEPRLLICLYGPPLLHVDLKFVMPSDLGRMVERPVVIWARDEQALSKTLDTADVRWPNRSSQWFEDRAWKWLHYCGTKLQRGELHEALTMVTFFRTQVLGPMLQRRHGLPQRGVRKVEQEGIAEALAPTIADNTADSLSRALIASTRLYVELRDDDPPERIVPGMPDLMIPWFDIYGARSAER